MNGAGGAGAPSESVQMNAALQARAVYGDARASVRSPSQIEYQAFAQVTTRLKNEQDADAARFPRLAEALHDNLRLWTLIAGGVADDENGLPEMLRARLFYLAEFTRDHTRKILRREAGAAPLIDINTAVMRGLRQQQGMG